MIYTLTLNPAIDYVAQLEQPLLPGAVNRSRREVFQFGGKGINVSNMLRVLGQDTVALGFIAGFTGDGLEQGLQAAGLTTRFIRLPEGNTRVNVKIKGQEETELNGAGPYIPAAAMAQLYAQLEDLAAGDVLVLSGSLPRGLSCDTYAGILSRVQEKNVLCAVDAAGPSLLQTLSCRPFLIKPNRQELEDIFHTALTADTQLADCARRLQQLGARNVLVSLAADGALLLDETGTLHRLPAPEGTVINSVGAGDSMVAGFLAGWLQTKDPAAALRLGIAAGSATAFSLGLADRSRVDQLLKKTDL